MAPPFQTVFDLTGQPEVIRPAYWFMAIFATAGIGLVCLSWFAIKKRWRCRRSLPIFTAAWIGGGGYGFATDIRNVADIRAAVESGNIEKTEGCLSYFRPGSPTGTKTTAGNEEWAVNGLVFSYGAGEVRPGFHRVSTGAGPIRANTRVRVSFVESPAFGRREIVKLEVASHACPMARSVEMFKQP